MIAEQTKKIYLSIAIKSNKTDSKLITIKVNLLSEQLTIRKLYTRLSTIKEGAWSLKKSKFPKVNKLNTGQFVKIWLNYCWLRPRFSTPIWLSIFKWITKTVSLLLSPKNFLLISMIFPWMMKIASRLFCAKFWLQCSTSTKTKYSTSTSKKPTF